MKRAVVVQIAVTWIWMGLRRSEPSLEILGIYLSGAEGLARVQVDPKVSGKWWALRFGQLSGGILLAPQMPSGPGSDC